MKMKGHVAGSESRSFRWNRTYVESMRPAKVLIMIKKRHNAFYGTLFCKLSRFQDIWFRFMINQGRQCIPDTINTYAGMSVPYGIAVSTQED